MTPGVSGGDISGRSYTLAIALLSLKHIFLFCFKMVLDLHSPFRLLRVLFLFLVSQGSLKSGSGTRRDPPRIKKSGSGTPRDPPRIKGLCCVSRLAHVLFFKQIEKHGPQKLTQLATPQF